MLIEGFDLEILTPPCEPGAQRFFARARLRVDISEALPFLNCVLSDASFTPAANSLIWERDGRKVACHAYEIDVNGIESRESADEVITEVVDLVNRTWDRRDELTPSFETIEPLTPMDVYRRLPQTNCGLCGESTCFIFALKLAASQRDLRDCPPLFDADNAENLAGLKAALTAAGRG